MLVRSHVRPLPLRRGAVLLHILAGTLLCTTACPPPPGGSNLSFLALLGLGGPAAPAPKYTVGGSVTGLGASESVTIQLNGAETAEVSSNTSFTFTTELLNTNAYKVLVSAATGTTCVASSNSGTIASSNVTSVAVHCSNTLYTLRVNVSGLNGSNNFVVQNNGTGDTTVSANGFTTISAAVPSGSMYAVTVKTQPSVNPQVCSPSGNTGQMSSTPTTVTILCSPDYYTVSGNYSGLAGAGLQIRLSNTGETLTRNLVPDGAAGAFSFTAPVAQGATWTVSIAQNPSNLNQTCTGSSGLVGAANVTTAIASCTTNQYNVGGTISGMTSGDTVTLLMNGGSNLVVSAASPSFSWALTDGATYAVTVMTHAPGKTCSVSSGTGTVAGAAVTNVSVSCAFNTYTVGGSVSGLCAGQSITVQNNGGSSTMVTGSTTFVFPAQNDLSTYAVTVSSTPSGVSCNVTSGTGSLAGANVTGVAVACTGCMSCAGAGQFTASWTASRSYEVNNATGGGHRVYYATSSGVSTSTTTYFNVPNTTSTTTGVLTGRTSGCTYFLKVQPYSTLRPAGASGAPLSTEGSIAVP